MSYKTPSNSLRVATKEKWDLNVTPKNLLGLNQLIYLKLFLSNFLIKKKIFIININNTLTPNNHLNCYIFLYYNYKGKKTHFTTNLIKYNLETVVEDIFNIKNAFITIFSTKDIIKKTLKRVNTEIYSKFKFNKKKKFLKDLIYITNLSIHCSTIELLAKFLVKELCKDKKQWIFIRSIFPIFKTFVIKEDKLEGLKIQIAGKLNGRNRKKKIIKIFGLIPTQTFNSNIKFESATNYNYFGAFSIKVWVNLKYN